MAHADEFGLAAEPPKPKRKRDTKTVARLPTADGLPSLRVLRDPLLGDCLAAFGAGWSGHYSPFVARVVGPAPDGTGMRYELAFLSSWLAVGALGGVGEGCGFRGAAVVPLVKLRPLDTLDIRHGLGPALQRGFYLWVPAVGLEPLTERDLRCALASPFRKQLLSPPLKGRGMAVNAEVPGG